MEPQLDLQLVLSCLDGDEKAWREIVLRYQKLVYNLAYRFTGRFDKAEDLAQEIFIKIYHNLSKYSRERGEFKNWVTVMSRNYLIDFIRREKKGWSRFGGSDELEKLEYHTGDAGPHRNLERHEEIGFVHDCLRELSPDLRQSLVLRDIDGGTYEEISGLLRVPLGTVKSRINRARIELARIMNMRKLNLMPAAGPAGELGKE